MTRKMKDSGIEWIGEIPKNWERVKLKSYYTFEKGKNAAIYTQEYIGLHEGEFSVYSGQTENNGIMGNIDTYDYDLDECIFTTTVGAKVMTTKLLLGKFSLSQNCLIMKQIKECNNHFFRYSLFPLFEYEKSLIPSYMQPSLRIEDLKRYIIVSPEIGEQSCIANYLDTHCTLIDQTIEKQKQVIEKLKEYKHSVITETVTKGMNPNVPMKDSGIEWVGEIPEHWEVKKIKNLFSYIDCRNTQDESAILLSLFTAIGVKPRSEMEDKGNKAATVIGYKYVEKGDLIVNKLLAWMGAIAFSDYEGVTSPDYDVYRIKENANAIKDYYNCYFRFTKFKDDCFKYGHGIMMMRWRTYPSEFLNIFVVNPPKEEQVMISKYVVKRNIEIDNAIETKEKVIEKLESFKKSLIYECVTGKREVN